MPFRDPTTSLPADSITGMINGDTQIQPGSITTPLLAADAITGLTITGVDIVGTSTITGATVQTATSGRRIKLTTDGRAELYSGASLETSPAQVYADLYATNYSILTINPPSHSGIEPPGMTLMVAPDGTRWWIMGPLRSYINPDGATGGVFTETDFLVLGNLDSNNYPAHAWHSFTPTWTAVSGANPAYGNATLACKYEQIGRQVTVVFDITFGSTTTYGTAANWQWTLPVTAAAAQQAAGWFELHATGGQRCIGRGRLTSTTQLQIEVSSGRVDAVAIVNNGIIDNISPWTWANGHAIRGIITYEAATD